MSLHILKILSVFAVLLSSLPAHAAERISVWGIYNGCERVPEFDRLLDRHLNKAGVTSWTLSAPQSACQGEACAERAQAECGLSDGLILGGRIWRTKQVLRVRLWLYDLASHKTAYDDEYCQDCDVNQLLVELTDRIRKQPKFGVGGTAEPSYCAASVSEARPDSRRNKLHYLVYGDGKGHAQVQAGLKEMLADTLRPLQPVPGDKKQYSHDELMRILGRNEGQVLGVELYKEGGAQVWLFDGMTEHLATEDVKCKECRVEELIQTIHSTLPELWGHCFDSQCSLAKGRPQASTAACEPIKELTCTEVLPSAGVKSAGNAALYASVDPSVSKTIKALTWGAFTIAGATAIGLFIANSSGSGSLANDAYHVSDPLIRPALVATGMAALTLAVAIPSTIVLDRKSRLPTSAKGLSSGDTPSIFRCPR